MILPSNPIPELIARYRVLKRQADALKSQMDGYRAQIEPLVEALDGQSWADSEGYARFATYEPSVAYDQKALDNLARVWANSTDSSIRTCGETLLSLRREVPGRKSLQLR